MTVDSILQYVINFINSMGLLTFVQAAVIILIAIFALNVILGRR